MHCLLAAGQHSACYGRWDHAGFGGFQNYPLLCLTPSTGRQRKAPACASVPLETLMSCRIPYSVHHHLHQDRSILDDHRLLCIICIELYPKPKALNVAAAISLPLTLSDPARQVQMSHKVGRISRTISSRFQTFHHAIVV